MKHILLLALFAPYVLAHPTTAKRVGTALGLRDDTFVDEAELADDESTSNFVEVTPPMPSSLAPHPSDPAVELFNGPFEGPLSNLLESLGSSDQYQLWKAYNMQLPRAFFTTASFTIDDDMDIRSVGSMRPFLGLFQNIQINLHHLSFRSGLDEDSNEIVALFHLLDTFGNQNLTHLTITIPDCRCCKITRWILLQKTIFQYVGQV
jgi:hypothetical protein